MNKILKIALGIGALLAAGSATPTAPHAERQLTVVDATDGETLPGVAIYDNRNIMIATSTIDGKLPRVAESAYPLTLRCTAYATTEVTALTAGASDTIAMKPQPVALGGVDVVAGERCITRMSYYIRELTDAVVGTDTMQIIAEYVADAFIPAPGTKKFKASRSPRILAKRNVMHVANSEGLDSLEVNSEDAALLSWVDIIDLPSDFQIPSEILGGESTLTRQGSNGVAEIMRQAPSRFHLSRDYLANTKEHRLSPTFLKMFGLTVDFTQMLFNLSYAPNGTPTLTAADMTEASLVLDAEMRGRWFRRMLHTKNDIPLRSRMELYVTDREYLTLSEAKELKKHAPKSPPILAPATVEPLDPARQSILARAGFDNARKQ